MNREGGLHRAHSGLKQDAHVGPEDNEMGLQESGEAGFEIQDGSRVVSLARRHQGSNAELGAKGQPPQFEVVTDFPAVKCGRPG